ncbi:hypothetical protein HPP92_025145 [Vanilla planifolia]|uniref:Dof zinc finger protein n=1 Tax=Vanilla planifolia TaxID=51239 RepID=A0A835PEU5_VANPL|nr:hypothetical protein HPP92_025145 [Vanilla planifolia]
MLPYCSFWPSMADRRWRPGVEHAPCCPRCDSSNTKFCYYNNYSLTQPRYFCKSCRRYWTKGGSLRNVPIGGGSRKSRRGRTARPPPSSPRSPPPTSFRPDHALESMASSLMCPYLKNTASAGNPVGSPVGDPTEGLFPVCGWVSDGIASMSQGSRDREEGMVSAILEDGDSALHQSLNLLEDWGVLGVL